MKTQTAATSKAAEMKTSHLLQIEALLEEGLSDPQRVAKFTHALGLTAAFEHCVLAEMHLCSSFEHSAAHALWNCSGPYEQSLFSDLPGCECPVVETQHGRRNYKLIPNRVPEDWQPTREVLEEFSRVQLEARGY